MPHVVIDKKIDLFDFLNKFQPVFQKSPLIKISEIFVERSGNSALLSTIVIEKLHQVFFIQISTTDNTTTIRIHSKDAKSTKKTDAVKLSLVLIYYQIKKQFNDVKIIQTNLNNFLREGKI